MEEERVDPETHVARPTASTSALTRRLMAAVLLAVGAFALTYRVVLLTATVDDAIALVVASGAAVGVAALAIGRIVAPLVESQADLHVRYQEALADALRDPLTDLGNHRAFQEELDRQVATARRYEIPLSLLLIDLDEFKSVNDGRGHAAGDRVLRGFGQLLAAGLRRADRAFRIGGDEFAVLLPHTDLDGARIVGRRLLAQALQPALRTIELDPISFSAGVSSFPQLAEGRAQLTAQADTALYAAKRGGRTDVVAFEPSMSDDAPPSDAASASVAEVIARGQLYPVYQPIVSLESGRPIGVEGLIRPLPPAPFSNPASLFAAAEASGRVVALDLACIETIVAGAGDLPADQFLSVNLSPATVESPEFGSASLLAILARHNFPPARLVIELTERQQIHDAARVRDRLNACRLAGMRFAADDIGAGNSGLRLLAEISFEILKVDLDLVRRSAAGGPSGAVLGSVVELASRTGALVVAEGIEEASQLPPLLALGIGAGQGYHLGRPGPIQPRAVAPQRAAVGIDAWRETIGLPSVS